MIRKGKRQQSQACQKIHVNGQDYIVIDKFMYCSTDYLGEGSFGKVFRGFSVPGQGSELEVAIKTFELPDQMSGMISDRDKMTLDTIRKEIIALKMLRHPNIVRLFDVKKLNKVIFMIMELCNGGTLSEYLKQNVEITELEIRYYFSQILNGFKYLRKKEVIHRDIKPENILLRNGVLKIADFGFAKQHDSKITLHSYLGTRATISPQVIMGGYTHKCDIWSLGATLFYMCFKEYPFKGFYASEVKLMEIMKRDQIEFPKNGMQISPQLKQVIINMMRFHEEERINWEDLFIHPLFQQNLMIEIGLNVFDLHSEESEDNNMTKSMIEKDVDQEFDFQLTDISEAELKKVELQAGSHLEKIDIKRRCDITMQQIINRITFEKGKCSVLKQLSKKVHDFELSLSSKTIFEKASVEIADHLKSLRFGINKFELIILRGMLEWFKVHKQNTYYFCKSQKNPLNIPEEDWTLFLENGDKDRIQKALEKEISIEKQFVYNVSQKVFNQIFQMNTSLYEKLQIADDFMSDDLQANDGFFITLFNLSIGLSKLLFPEIIKIKSNQELIHKILPTLTLVDDLFILMSLESIFPYSEDTALNFNVFNEQRKKNYTDDPDTYNLMYQRVLRTYEVFFE